MVSYFEQNAQVILKMSRRHPTCITTCRMAGRRLITFGERITDRRSSCMHMLCNLAEAIRQGVKPVEGVQRLT